MVLVVRRGVAVQPVRGVAAVVRVAMMPTIASVAMPVTEIAPRRSRLFSTQVKMEDIARRRRAVLAATDAAAAAARTTTNSNNVDDGVFDPSLAHARRSLADLLRFIQAHRRTTRPDHRVELKLHLDELYPHYASSITFAHASMLISACRAARHPSLALTLLHRFYRIPHSPFAKYASEETTETTETISTTQPTASSPTSPSSPLRLPTPQVWDDVFFALAESDRSALARLLFTLLWPSSSPWRSSSSPSTTPTAADSAATIPPSSCPRLTNEHYKALFRAHHAQREFDDLLLLYRACRGGGTTRPPVHLPINCYAMVMQALEVHRDWQFALQVLDDAGQQHAQLDLALFQSAIQVMSVCGKVDVATSLLRVMMAKGLEPTAATYTSMITACANAGSFDDAVRIFHEMVKNGVALTFAVYRALIQACGQHRREQEALLLLRDMTKHGFRPDARVYVAMIDMCAEAAMWDTVMLLLFQMRDADMRPSVSLCTKIVCALMQRELWDHAQYITSLMSRWRIAPSVHLLHEMIVQLDRFDRNGAAAGVAGAGAAAHPSVVVMGSPFFSSVRALDDPLAAQFTVPPDAHMPSNVALFDPSTVSSSSSSSTTAAAAPPPPSPDSDEPQLVPVVMPGSHNNSNAQRLPTNRGFYVSELIDALLLQALTPASATACGSVQLYYDRVRTQLKIGACSSPDELRAHVGIVVRALRARVREVAQAKGASGWEHLPPSDAPLHVDCYVPAANRSKAVAAAAAAVVVEEEGAVAAAAIVAASFVASGLARSADHCAAVRAILVELLGGVEPVPVRDRPTVWRVPSEVILRTAA